MRQTLAAVWFTFAFATVAVSSAHFWLDSGEIGSAGADLGVMHPPGVAGFIPLVHLAGLIPVGNLGFRMALVSAAFAAAAVGVMVELLRRRKAHPMIVWGAVLWVSSGLTFLRNARVVEIYTFGAFLFMVTLWGFDPAVRERDRTSRRLVGTLAAVLGAWGFGDLRLCFVIPVILGWAWALRAKRPWSKWAPLCVGIASLPVLTIPLSSARGPLADWGDPDELARLWDHLQARTIRESFSAQILPTEFGPWWMNLQAALGRLGEDLGPVGPVAVALALMVGLRSPEQRGVRWGLGGLLVVELLYTVGINPMGGDDRQTGLPLAFLAATLVALALHLLVEGRPRLRWIVLPLVWAILISPAALVGWRDAANTRSWAPHLWTRAALAQLAPGSLLLTQSDDLSAGVASARVLEGARPDVISLPGQHLYHPCPDEASARPQLASIWEAASEAESEAGKIAAALRVWEGPLAVESPGVEVMATIDWEVGPGPPPVSLPPNESTQAPTTREIIEEWLVSLPTTLDRRRLAHWLGMRNRVRIWRGAQDPRAWLEAKRDFELVLSLLSPTHGPSLVSLGAIEDRLGNTDRAIALTEQALELEPTRYRALTNLALYELKRGDRDAARALAERATTYRPDLSLGWIRLAESCEELGDEDCVTRAGARIKEIQGQLAPPN